MRYGNRCKWVYARHATVLGWQRNDCVIRSGDLCGQCRLTRQSCLPHGDNNDCSGSRMEQHLIVRQGMPGADGEHALLDRVHHQFVQHPARNCRRGVSWDSPGQRLGKCPARERGASCSIWSNIGDPILLFDVLGTKQQVAIADSAISLAAHSRICWAGLQSKVKGT